MLYFDQKRLNLFVYVCKYIYVLNFVLNKRVFQILHFQKIIHILTISKLLL